MAAVVGTSLRHGPAFLPDFSRFKVRNEQYPGVVPSKGSVVEGLVCRDITAQGWSRLDRFEGDMYVRRRIVVRYPDNTEGATACYIVKPEYRQMLTRTPWEFEAFIRQGKKIFLERYMGFKDIE